MNNFINITFHFECIRIVFLYWLDKPMQWLNHLDRFKDKIELFIQKKFIKVAIKIHIRYMFTSYLILFARYYLYIEEQININPHLRTD